MRFLSAILAATSLATTGFTSEPAPETEPTLDASAQLRPEAPPGKYRRAPRRVAGEYIVVLTPDAYRDAREVGDDLARTYRGQMGHVFRNALRGFVAHMSEEDAKALAEDPRVQYVEENGEVFTTGVQTGATWGLDRVDQPSLPLDQTYTYNNAGAGVNAYIIDTGIKLAHAEFGGRARTGFDAVTPGGNADDCNGHGTHVAGTVGGATWGLAKEVNLYAVRVLGCTGSGTYAGVIAGIDWVTRNHIKPAVANMSLGGGASQAVDDAVTASIASGVVYAVAAGNDNGNACLKSPARTPNALTVGSTTNTDARSSFSNYGSCVDIFAPGSNITSAWHTSNTAINTISGPSMASPHVAGAAALYLSSNPTASPEQVANVLTNLATAGKVIGPGTGSPNLLLYTGALGSGSGDNTAPTVTFTSPAHGSTVSGNVTLTASASDDVGVTRVAFFINGALASVDTAAPFEHVWNTTLDGNGSQTLMAKAYDAGGNVGTTSASVTVNNPGVATYSATLKAPLCGQLGGYCDSSTLLNGRGSVGPEKSAPNTLNSSCADGNSGSYRKDESLERIRIATVDGSPMAPGKTVRVSMTVWAWSTGSSDSLDIYYTGDAARPTWTYLTTLKPPAGGSQVLSATYTLPPGNLQAVRGNFRYSGSVGTCTSGGYNDRDDLAFTVGSPPEASFAASCFERSCDFSDTSSDVDGDIVSWSWDFGDRTTSSERNPGRHTYARTSDYVVTLTVTDSAGLSSTTQQVVTTTDPVIYLSTEQSWVRNVRSVFLTWSNAPGTEVNLFRDGDFLGTLPNTGAHTDHPRTERPDYVYTVCEVGTNVCAQPAVVSFLPEQAGVR